MRYWLAALGGLTLIRLTVAAALPLSPDEAYYWVWSRALAGGYLDHPPMVALWIRASSWLAGDGAFGIRLLGPLSAAVGAVLLADAGRYLFPGRRAGVTAAALLNATLLLGVGTVVITPDTPLLLFWTATLWTLARAGRSRDPRWLLAGGVCAGLAFDSKYTAVFLGVATALWLLLVPPLRRWWRTPYPWAAALLALGVSAPVLAWNAAHGWASFLKQGSRAGASTAGRSAQFLGELAMSQIGLATPLVFVLLLAGLAAAVRGMARFRDPAWALLACATMPALLVFLLHALGDRVQGNWPAILYPGAALAAAGVRRPGLLRLRIPAVALGLAMVAAVYGQSAFAVIPLGRVDPSAMRLAGWPGLASEVETARRVRGLGFVAADEYGLAAELARALPPGYPVLGTEPRWLLFDLPQAAQGSGPGLLVRSARRRDPPDSAAWTEVEEIGQASRVRDGRLIEEYRLFQVSPRPGHPVGAVLPRRLPVAPPSPRLASP